MPTNLLLFGILLWKNWKLQLRKKLVTLFEILLPTIFCVILILLRTLVVTNDIKNPITYPAHDIKCLPKNLMDNSSFFIGFSPDNDVAKQVMESAVKDIQCTLNMTVKGFRTESDMENTLTYVGPKTDNTQKYFGGVAFDLDSFKKGNFTKDVHYTIRLSYTLRSQKKNSFVNAGKWYTERIFPIFMIPGPRNGANSYGPNPNYHEEGFLALQHAIDKSLIKNLGGSDFNSSNVDSTSVQMQVFPYPPYLDDKFLVVLQTQVPFLFMLSLIFIALNIPREVVLEKELKLKEAMKMMGLNNWLHWLAWFIKYVMFLAIATGIMTLLVCPPFEMPADAHIFTNSDSSLVFVFLFLYAISTVCFCFMISVFFDKANAAAAAGGILFFCTYIPYFFIQPNYERLSAGEKYAASLLNNNAMSLGAYIIAQFESAGGGAYWSNFAQPVNVDDNFSLAECMLMLIVDSIIYFLIMWYVEAVFPGSYGVPLKWYFPFQPSYWCGTKQILGKPDESARNGMSDMFEEDPVGVQAGVNIQGLSKVFYKGKRNEKVAVKNMHLKMFEGQITALLGHNGAGKTTTMFMLTGFLPPTSGDAVVNGYSISKDIINVRANLGLCPQHNILFNNLTVEEHLWFFGKLKGCTKDTIDSEMDYFLKRMDLEPKRKSFASTLSGGQKRKLSVIIALIGGSKVVILDEPTSGMDPSARRHMWDVLQEQRAGRTMVLSTHFMDEADHLGDRIAIMADGVVQCTGSPLFLKNKYGAGYHMVMVKSEDCDVQKITNLIKQHIPNSKLESSVAAEISYILPQEDVQHFEKLFLELETRRQALGILSFGISVTTMEEVFLRVGESADKLQNSADMNNKIKERIGEAFEDGENVPLLPITNRVVHTFKKQTGVILWLQQFYAMFVKRMLFTRRNILLTLSQIIMPLFFTILTILIYKTLPKTGTLPALDLSISQFDSPNVYYDVSHANSSYTKSLAKDFSSMFDKASVSTKRVQNVSASLVDVGIESMSFYSFDFPFATKFSDVSSKTLVTALFNAAPYHSAAVAVSAVDNAILRNALGKEFSILSRNHPLPQSVYAKTNAQASSFDPEGFSYSSNIMFGMSFLAASFVVFLIRERTDKVKHSQYVSGVGPSNFWMATLAWDMINYLVPSVLIVISFAAFQIDNFYINHQWALLLILLVFYGLALLPNVYLLQFLFTGPATGYVVIAFYNILTGITPVLIVSILDIVNEKSVADALTWVFIVLLPNFNMGQGLVFQYNNYKYVQACTKEIPDLFNKQYNLTLNIDEICKLVKEVGATLSCCKDSCGQMCIDWTLDDFSWETPGLGRPLCFLAVQCILFWTIIFTMESESLRTFFYWMRRKKVVFSLRRQDSAHLEDDDVEAEGQKAQDATSEPVIVSGLSKNYGLFKAVDSMDLVIPKGECFGLLGINGAGKTTTFRMLTGDEIVSSGEAVLNGYSVRRQIKNVQESLGYCPQFDALIDQMTGEEMLYMYARLRGIPSADISRVVNDLLTALLLQAHAKKLTREYSGGNKRKLSTAISLIGDPPVVFLDEPTTGMDPVAKRMLWDTLTHVRNSGKTLVLTSHSMEECEALCTRMAIMVNGRFRCIGSTQHLKTKFGEGYSLLARVGYSQDGSPPDLTDLRTFIEDSFPGSVLKDIHQNLVQYSISSSNLTWSHIFGTLEREKGRLNIEDYSVSQTTLEQVFIGFARSQQPPSEVKPGFFSRLKAACICCTPEYVVNDVVHRNPSV